MNPGGSSPGNSLDDWLVYLETLHPSNIELGLDRVAAVARRLPLDRGEARVITVAGTNGKGTTTALLEHMALAAGMRVGVYTSPHLVEYNERVRVNGENATDGALVAAFEAIEAVREDIPLTYFEFGTLAALQVFADSELDLVVLEVGLGGRLDAVNIIDADIAVITAVSLDHEAWLGNDRESIGREKAGVLRPGIDAVIADADPPASVLARVEELGCRCHLYRDDKVQLPEGSGLRAENLFAALTAAELAAFGPAPGELASLLEGFTLPGRCQLTECGEVPVVLDVGHNPAAAEHLAQWLESRVDGPRIALFAALSDKDIHAMIRPCLGLFDHWYAVGLPGVSRALSQAELARQMSEAGASPVDAAASVADAWAIARQQHPGTTVVVFGSFFTVAAYFELLGEGPVQA